MGGERQFVSRAPLLRSFELACNRSKLGRRGNAALTPLVGRTCRSAVIYAEQSETGRHGWRKSSHHAGVGRAFRERSANFNRVTPEKVAIAEPEFEPAIRVYSD